jgi:hypothetical protein
LPGTFHGGILLGNGSVMFVTLNREFDQHFRIGSLASFALRGRREGTHLDYQVDNSLSCGRHNGPGAG